MKIVFIELVIYLVGMVAIGAYCGRKNATQEDFLLGGRKIPGWALAISERATTSSSWIYIGATAVVYTAGFSGIWLFVGNFAALVVLWLWFAKIYRNESVKYNSLTVTEYLTTRWGEHAGIIRTLSVFIVITFYFFFAGSQFAGASKTLYALFGINKVVGMLITAVIVVVYAALGGFKSIVWTDVVQGFIMVFALILLLIVGFAKIKAGGGSLMTSVAGAGSNYTSFTAGLTGFSAVIMLFNHFSWFFGYYGQPAQVRKFMALGSDDDIKKARNVAFTWAIVIYVGIFLIGLMGLGIYGPNAFEDPELLFPTMVSDLLPVWLAGICLCAVVAAILSTTADQLLAITGAVTVDLMKRAFKMEMSEEKTLKVSRITLFFAGVLGFATAYFSKAFVFKMVSFAWTGIGSTLTPAMLLTLFMKRCSGAGIVATLITGLIFTFVWSYTPLAFISGRAGAFFIALFAGIVVSLLIPNKSDDIKPDAVENNL